MPESLLSLEPLFLLLLSVFPESPLAFESFFVSESEESSVLPEPFALFELSESSESEESSEDEDFAGPTAMTLSMAIFVVFSSDSVSLSFTPSTYVTAYVCWISPFSPSCRTVTSPGCRLGSTMVCVSNGTSFVRVSSPCVTLRTRRMVFPPSFSTLTRSSLLSVMPLESRMEAAGSLPFGATELLPSAMTVTGPFWLMTKPPVSLL